MFHIQSNHTNIFSYDLPDRKFLCVYFINFLMVSTRSSTVSSFPALISSITQVRICSARSSLLKLFNAELTAATCTNMSVQYAFFSSIPLIPGSVPRSGSAGSSASYIHLLFSVLFYDNGNMVLPFLSAPFCLFPEFFHPSVSVHLFLYPILMIPDTILYIPHRGILSIPKPIKNAGQMIKNITRPASL